MTAALWTGRPKRRYRRAAGQKDLVAKLTDEDMIAISAYLTTRPPF
jgi:cytochrome c553